MVRPAVPDPPEVTSMLWDGFGCGWGGTPAVCGWDVGANCGQSIPPMSRLFRRIICFEPHPGSFEYLSKAVSGKLWSKFGDLEDPQIEVHQLAVTDRDGELVLALPPGEQTETGQLVTPGTPDMEWSQKDWSAVPRVTVPGRSADSLAYEFGLPGFIKVDTEGHEAKVMNGAEDILATGMTDWLIEFHSEANSLWCQGALKDAGYKFELYRHPHYRENSRLWKAHGWIRAFAPHPELQSRLPGHEQVGSVRLRVQLPGRGHRPEAGRGLPGRVRPGEG